MAELEKLIRLAERLAFGPSTQALLDEAAGRDIPYIRLDRFSLVQLGQGVHQQRIRATMTSRGPAASRWTSRPTRSSPTGSWTRRDCPFRAPRSSRPRTRPSRPPGASATRASSSRSTATTAAASPWTSRSEDDVRAALPESRCAQSRRGDVVVESYITGSDYRVPRDRRQARGGRRARPGQRHRRRRAHDPRAGRRDQRGPAPRHRPREGPDQDPARRERRRGPRGPGLHAPTASPTRAPS